MLFSRPHRMTLNHKLITSLSFLPQCRRRALAVVVTVEQTTRLKCNISMAKASPRHNSNELQTNEWVPFLLQFSSIHNYFIVTLSIVIRCNIQHVRKTLTLEWVFLIKYSITRKRIKSSLPLSFAITIETITNFFFPPLTPHTFSSSASLLCWVQMWGKFNQNRARVLLLF